MRLPTSVKSGPSRESRSDRRVERQERLRLLDNAKEGELVASARRTHLDANPDVDDCLGEGGVERLDIPPALLTQVLGHSKTAIKGTRHSPPRGVHFAREPMVQDGRSPRPLEIEPECQDALVRPPDGGRADQPTDRSVRPKAAAHGAVPCRRRWLETLTISALAIAPYLLSLTGPFVFDDTNDITTRADVHALWPPAWLDSGRPVVTLSFVLCWLVGGGATGPFHVFNVAIHTGNALLLREVVSRACSLPRVAAPVRAHAGTIATWTAALWCVHPLHTSAVTYIVHRYESMASLFYLLTLLTFLHMCEVASNRIRWSACLCVTAALACWSKEIAITLPVSLILMDATLVSDSWRSLVRRQGPAHGLVAVTCFVSILAVIGPRDVNSSQGMHLTELRPQDYARTELGVIARYMRQTVWPSDLVIDYYDWPIARTISEVMPGALVTIGALAITAALFARKPALGFVCAWFFILLAPTSSVLPLAGELVAERRLYLALAAPALLVALALNALRSFHPRLALALLSVVVSALSITTLVRNLDYRSATALFSRTVARRPNNPRARYNYGNALKDEGRFDLALAEYRSCIAIEPGYMAPYANAVAAANRLQLRNPWADEPPLSAAEAEARDASASALVARADADVPAGRRTEALAALREAARLAPRSDAAWVRLAILLSLEPDLLARRGDEALQASLRAWGLRGGVLDPSLGEALAAAFAELGRFDDAIRVAKQLRSYLEAAGMDGAAHAQGLQIDAYQRHERWMPRR